VRFIPRLEGKLILAETDYSEMKKRSKYPSQSWIYLQKFFLFDAVMKNWQVVLYVDSGMVIMHSLSLIFELSQSGFLLAHSDAYPVYNDRFIDKCSCDRYPSECQRMIQELNVNLTVDFFQSTFLLFDTAIIEKDTVSNLFSLVNRFNFLPGDQTYMTLYFHVLRKQWKQVPLVTKNKEYFSYDFCPRGSNSTSNYVLHKYLCPPKSIWRVLMQLFWDYS